MGNMPTMGVDPDGNIAFLALGAVLLKGALIGAGISAAAYTASVGLSNGGFQNWSWGQFGSAVGMGALSGAASAGIGQAFGGVGSIGKGTFSLGKELGRAGAHALASGGVSALSGNEGAFWSGTAAGGFGSLSGSYFGGKGLSGGALIAGSTLSGGIGAELGGGDFLAGAAQGGIIAGANHILHRASYKNLPGFDELEENYLDGEYDPAAVYDKVGGNAKRNYDANPADFENTCTIRVCRSLNAISGHEIPFAKDQTFSGADGKYSYYRVKDFKRYLRRTYGPETISGVKKSDYSGSRGIIGFEVSGWNNATGHFSLWNGSRVLYEDYFNRASAAFLWKTKN
jgi:hypothetical protein